METKKRVKIIAGRKKVGDLAAGHIIKSLGKEWEEFYLNGEKTSENAPDFEKVKQFVHFDNGYTAKVKFQYAYYD